MRDKRMPLVSVIMPVFNGEEFLEEAILSVFAQTYPNYELVVVHDGSENPGIRKICGRYKDRLTYIFQKNTGTAGARNTAIRHSSGEYVAFLDEDDVWFPEKLERQAAFYDDLKRQGKTPCLIYSGFYVTDENGKTLQKGLFSSSGENFTKLLFGNFVGTPCSVMVDRKILDTVGLFDESIRGCEDYELWLRISTRYPLYSLNEYLAKYRLRKNTLSKDPEIVLEGLRKSFSKVLSGEKRPEGRIAGMIPARINAEAAFRFKNAAYERLFKQRNAGAFRRYLKRAWSLDRTTFGARTLFYYLLSFISVSFCVWLKKHKERGFHDVFVDVNGTALEDWVRRKEA